MGRPETRASWAEPDAGQQEETGAGVGALHFRRPSAGMERAPGVRPGVFPSQTGNHDKAKKTESLTGLEKSGKTDRKKERKVLLRQRSDITLCLLRFSVFMFVWKQQWSDTRPFIIFIFKITNVFQKPATSSSSFPSICL